MNGIYKLEDWKIFNDLNSLSDKFRLVDKCEQMPEIHIDNMYPKNIEYDLVSIQDVTDFLWNSCHKKFLTF